MRGEGLYDYTLLRVLSIVDSVQGERGEWGGNLFPLNSEINAHRMHSQSMSSSSILSVFVCFKKEKER